MISTSTMNLKKNTIFGEKSTSTLTGVACLLSWSSWNLEMLVFVEEGKPANSEEKTLAAWREPTTNPTHRPERNRTWAKLVEDKHSHHCSHHYVILVTHAQLCRMSYKMGSVSSFWCHIFACKFMHASIYRDLWALVRHIGLFKKVPFFRKFNLPIGPWRNRTWAKPLGHPCFHLYL